MSKFTDFGEDAIAEFFSGLGITLPTDWTVVPGSAGSDAGVTEITGMGIAPATVARSLAKWKSTQGDSLASNGTSKSTSNTDAISFGTPTGSATLTHVGLRTGSDDVIWTPVTPVAFTSGSPSPLQIAPGALRFTLGMFGGATHYLVNKMIDLIWRGQAYSWSTELGLSYFTTAPTDAGGGVEPNVGGYGRISLVPGIGTLANTGGRLSNIGLLTHPDPTGAQGTAVATGIHDALTLGNLLWWKNLVEPISVVALADGGVAPYYDPDTLAITIA